MGAMIAFGCPDGGEASGILAEAVDACAGVVVIQEWWGLNDQIEGVAARRRPERDRRALGRAFSTRQTRARFSSPAR